MESCGTQPVLIHQRRTFFMSDIGINFGINIILAGANLIAAAA